MKVVFDANVFVSGLSRRNFSAPTILMDMWKRGTFEVVVSQHILTKIEEAWRKPYFRTFLTNEEIAFILAEVSALAGFVTPADDVHGVAEDDEDDLVLATAVAANADYLVTGDKYLLRIGEFRGTPIVSPREFLDLMLPPE